jgi:hypothetical protein
VVTNIRDREGSELVIILVPTDTFANEISEAIRGMIQLCIGVYSINLEFVEGYAEADTQADTRTFA